MKGTLDNIKNMEERFDLILIDGMNISYKFSWVHRDLTSKDGKETGLFFGVIRFIHYLKKKYKCKRIIILWDTKPKYKKSISNDYKANRDHSDKKNFFKQVKELRYLLSLYNIDQAYSNGYEADDLACFFVKRELKTSKEILLVSNDNDWFQLLLRKDIKILKGNEIFNRETIEEKYNLNIEKQCLFKAITGDGKENVKGIPGIRKKLVWELIENVDSIEEVIDKCYLEDNKWYSEIIKNKDTIIKNYKLKELISEGYDIQYIEKKNDFKKLLSILKKYNMNFLVRELGNE